MVQIAVQVVYEGLAAHRWSDAELVELSAVITSQNFAADCKFTMRGEMGWQDAIGDYLRKKPEALFMTSDVMWGENSESIQSSLVSHLIGLLIPSGWLYQNQVNCARMMTKCIIPIADETNQTFSVKTYWQAENSFQDFTSFSIFHYLQKMLTPALGISCRKFALCQNALNLANTAIALERCRLARGEYPELLTALAPQFIAQVPHDVIGGQPLKYRRTEDGQFVLYSVGWNETDDGGVVVFREYSPNTPDLDKGDWVWRYPQK